jgi:hypothetical protein
MASRKLKYLVCSLTHCRRHGRVKIGITSPGLPDPTWSADNMNRYFTRLETVATCRERAL